MIYYHFKTITQESDQRLQLLRINLPFRFTGAGGRRELDNPVGKIIENTHNKDGE